MNNMWSNSAEHLVLLLSSVVPLPQLPQLGGKLAGESAASLLL